jgi:hypothetical protein
MTAGGKDVEELNSFLYLRIVATSFGRAEGDVMT